MFDSISVWEGEMSGSAHYFPITSILAFPEPMIWQLTVKKKKKKNEEGVIEKILKKKPYA